MEGHGLKPDGRFFEALVRVLATSPSSSPVARLRQQQRQQEQEQRQQEAEDETESTAATASSLPTPQASALRKLPWGGAGPVAALSSCSSSLLVLFNTAIHACAAGGDWRLALDLLHDMKKEGLRPDYYSYQVNDVMEGEKAEMGGG
jgi:pentatricopeptide repeat protein